MARDWSSLAPPRRGSDGNRKDALILLHFTQAVVRKPLASKEAFLSAGAMHLPFSSFTAGASREPDAGCCTIAAQLLHENYGAGLCKVSASLSERSRSRSSRNRSTKFASVSFEKATPALKLISAVGRSNAS